MSGKSRWRWKLPAAYLILVAVVAIALTTVVLRGPAPDDLDEAAGLLLSVFGAPWVFFLTGVRGWWPAVAALLLNTATLHMVGRFIDRGLRLTSA